MIRDRLNMARSLRSKSEVPESTLQLVASIGTPKATWKKNRSWASVLNICFVIKSSRARFLLPGILFPVRTCCFAFVAVLHSSGESPIMPLRSLGRLKIRKLLVDECKSRSNTHFPATAMIMLRPDQNGSPTFHRKIS